MMTTLKMVIELTYDEDIMYGDDADGKQWFLNLLKDDCLYLFSSEIGDDIGNVKILKYKEVTK